MIPIKEDHPLYCRGLTIPIEVMNAFLQGDVSSTEVLLSAYIDALVDGHGVGCWASNRHLAGKFNVHPTHISKMVNHLLQIEILVHVGWITIGSYKFRILETSWSRPLQKSATVKEMKEKIKDVVRKRHGTESKVSINQEIVFTLRKNVKGTLRKKAKHRYLLTEGITSRRKNRVGGSLEKSSGTNGRFDEHRTKLERFDEDVNNQFYAGVCDYLSKNKGRFKFKMPDRSKGIAIFKKIRMERDNDTQLVRSVVERYLKRMGDDYMPEAFCASSLRKKFDNIQRRLEKKKIQDGVEPRFRTIKTYVGTNKKGEKMYDIKVIKE